MKENKYDDDSFFEQYSHFPRSVEGLSAAGEWHALQKILPDFAGRRVLDIGCGFGWHCAYALQQGAAHVVGTDISAKMLAVAREKTPSPKAEYLQMAMEDMDFPDGSFDIVLSSLALHYTPDFGAICRKVYRFLAPGGQFVFSAEHPIFTAQGPQDWAFDKAGTRLHWPVDHYFTEGPRQAVFLGETVVKYHKTLATYLQTLLDTGFAITGVVEPTPEEKKLDEVESARDELRRPMMLLVSAVK